MKKFITSLIVLLSLNCTAFAQSNLNEIRKTLAPLLVDDKILKVVEVENTGFLEVVTEKGIFYTNKEISVLFQGMLVDVKTRTNLTEKSKKNLGAFDFKQINLKDAIKMVRGDGSRKIITIEDPNCGYCHRLMSELNKMTNITVYTFVVPILGEDSKRKAKSIMCAADKTKTWVDFMSNPSQGVQTNDCEVSFDNSINLMRKLRLAGTPAILFEDNTIVPGTMQIKQMEEKFEKITKPKG
ncbi:DsbC family protein [Undibacterium sp.]|uniref:DsbC family protein n=1 Tax=Undibacterium sp. TaxID=1914977 RepID=UPI003751C2CF